MQGGSRGKGDVPLVHLLLCMLRRSWITPFCRQTVANPSQCLLQPSDASRCPAANSIPNLPPVSSQTLKIRMESLRRRRLWNSSQENRLRTGCNDDRPLPVAFPLGSVSQTQSCRQTAHIARSARQHSHSNNRYRWQNSRSQHPRSDHLGSRRDLFDGSRISGFLQAIQHSPVRRLLHHQSEKTIRLQTASFNAGRQDARREIRSNRYAEKLLPKTKISRTIAAYSLLRSRDAKAPDFPHQQFSPLCSDYCRPLSMPLEGGTLLSLDQAASEDKGLLRNIRKCRKNTSVDRNFCLCVGCHCQKAPQLGSKSLFDSTDFRLVAIGENPYFTSTFGH
jgi:hypothetical protein